METRTETISRTQVAAFATLVTLASLDVAYKYLGWAGVAGYAVVVFAAVFAISAFLPRIDALGNPRWVRWLVFAFFAAMIIGIIIVYPIANSGRFGGGSDADDALYLAANELLNCRYPFYPRTYLGNPIAPMPGAVILAAPFVLLNFLPLQNVFWLGAFYKVLRKQISSCVMAFALFAAAILLSPAVWQNLATVTDRTSNVIYILIAMWLMMRYIPDDEAPTWKKLASAAFLGVGLSSRANFLFLLPLLFAALNAASGWKIAIRYLAVTVATAAIVTLPFYVYDPAAFTPWTTQGQKIVELETVLPYARYLTPALGMLLGSAFALRRPRANSWQFYWYCAVLQMNMILIVSALSTMKLGYADLYFGHVSYGVFALFFAVMAAGTKLGDEKRERLSSLTTIT